MTAAFESYKKQRVEAYKKRALERVMYKTRNMAICTLDAQAATTAHAMQRIASTLSTVTPRGQGKLRCPKEHCVGVVREAQAGPPALSSGRQTRAWACDLCDTAVCPGCHATMTEAEHECAPDDVARVAFLRETTTQCPTCFTHIEKSTGCNHMFCVICHTSFDYRTRKVLKNPSNPEAAALTKRGYVRCPQVPETFLGRTMTKLKPKLVKRLHASTRKVYRLGQQCQKWLKTLRKKMKAVRFAVLHPAHAFCNTANDSPFSAASNAQAVFETLVEEGQAGRRKLVALKRMWAALFPLWEHVLHLSRALTVETVFSSETLAEIERRVEKVNACMKQMFNAGITALLITKSYRIKVHE